jgi:uncharacterized repeat protein (TIGR03803 family)
MKVKLLLVALVVFGAGQAARAGNSQPTPVYTFLCNGNVELRYGRCPQGGRTDGLFVGSDNNLYGIAQVNEEGNSNPLGGTVFSYTTQGKLTVLYDFLPGQGNNYPNGTSPGSLIEGPDGKLYGATAGGGSTNGGVLFRINRNGTGFTILHTFCTGVNCQDGSYGDVAVVGNDGNIYGTCYGGGANGYGVIFRVIPSTGEYDVLYSFSSAADSGPSSVILGPGGNLYGILGMSLFQYNPANGAFQSYQLPFPVVNGLPSAPFTFGVTLGPNGNLYGLYAFYSADGIGLYEVNPDGTNFQTFPEYDPNFVKSGPAYMLFASDGNFWVTEYNSGPSNGGIILTVSPSTGGLLATEATFNVNGNTGAYPDVLIQLKNKTFVGATTQYGTATAGDFADGVIFSLNAGS